MGADTALTDDTYRAPMRRAVDNYGKSMLVAVNKFVSLFECGVLGAFGHVRVDQIINNHCEFFRALD
ncbi:MAG: hypothetical protein LC730_06790 [Acidobacteria bacterium]|nr:hypothetical protein [Acidobacteriota bacterium]